MKLQSYAIGQWVAGAGKGTQLFNAYNGEMIAEASSDGLDFAGMLEYARTVGGPSLRQMTFHERGRMLKALAQYLMSRKKEFYDVSPATGATKLDSWIDIDGGIGTLFTYASKSRREASDEEFYIDGTMEMLSREGTFVGQHICVPKEGVAVHINAFNFPCWGMLEKLAPTLIAGMPAIVKPATATSFLTEKIVRAIIESEIVPPGALQLIIGSTGDLLDNLTCQDVVTFTGSASTGLMLKQKPSIIENSVRFNMETDSLNCSILGPDAIPGSEEFELFIKEVVTEMTVKAGQKCTAIRRTIVPENMTQEVITALKDRLMKVSIGDPTRKDVRMGPLASRAQVEEVLQRVEDLKGGCEIVLGDPQHFEIMGGDREKGAFCPTMLLYCDQPFDKSEPHEIEAFGPVSTVITYKTTEEAMELARLGRGSLVGSVCTYDDGFAREIVLGLAPYHGRIMVLNRDCAGESTGHGSPLPHLVHGGPGRAGGGEEMGGLRGTLHYMQRCAIQGSPTTLSKVANRNFKGSRQRYDRIHPFQKYFEELEIGDTLITHRRTVTEADIVNFAGISGDFFYAHTDEIAAANNKLFEQRVAHGYLLLAMAAGLFVWPGEGPVLANYGLDNLRFIEPVFIGDTIHVVLTVREKTLKEKRDEDETPSGIVQWDVEVLNQNEKLVASYVILTLVARKDSELTH